MIVDRRGWHEVGGENEVVKRIINIKHYTMRYAIITKEENMELEKNELQVLLQLRLMAFNAEGEIRRMGLRTIAKCVGVGYNTLRRIVSKLMERGKLRQEGRVFFVSIPQKNVSKGSDDVERRREDMSVEETGKKSGKKSVMESVQETGKESGKEVVQESAQEVGDECKKDETGCGKNGTGCGKNGTVSGQDRVAEWVQNGYLGSHFGTMQERIYNINNNNKYISSSSSSSAGEQKNDICQLGCETENTANALLNDREWMERMQARYPGHDVGVAVMDWTRYLVDSGSTEMGQVEFKRTFIANANKRLSAASRGSYSPAGAFGSSGVGNGASNGVSKAPGTYIDHRGRVRRGYTQEEFLSYIASLQGDTRRRFDEGLDLSNLF